MTVLDVLRQISSNVGSFSILFLGVCVVLNIVIQVGQKLFKCLTAIANYISVFSAHLLDSTKVLAKCLNIFISSWMFSQ